MLKKRVSLWRIQGLIFGGWGAQGGKSVKKRENTVIGGRANAPFAPPPVSANGESCKILRHNTCISLHISVNIILIGSKQRCDNS